MNTSLSNAEMNVLKALGWRFVQYGPNEWTWLLFCADGAVNAQQGSAMWEFDVKTARQKCEGMTR